MRRHRKKKKIHRSGPRGPMSSRYCRLQESVLQATPKAPSHWLPLRGPRLLFWLAIYPLGCGSKLKSQGYAGLSLWFQTRRHLCTFFEPPLGVPFFAGKGTHLDFWAGRLQPRSTMSWSGKMLWTPSPESLKGPLASEVWPIGCGSKLNRRGYAGFGPCFHLPGFHLVPVF